MLVRYIKFYWVRSFVRLLLDQLSEVVEFSCELLFSSSFSLLLLKLVKIISSSAASHIDVICHDTRFFEKLYVCHFFVR